MHIPDIVNYFLHHAHRHLGPGFFFFSILSIKYASTTYMNPFDMLGCEINALHCISQRSMSNGFIYVVDAHFIDKIETKKKSWTQVPVIMLY